VLVPHEVAGLFQVFEKLRADGYAIVFITHKLREVLANANRITVMRHGQVAGTLLGAEANEDTLVSLMFGMLPPEQIRPNIKTPKSDSAPLLELRQVDTRSQAMGVSLSGVDLRIMPGEIVGVAGVSGSGQKELGDVILGLETCVQGTKHLSGQDASRWSTARIRASGVAFIPEDPLTMAGVPMLSVQENMALGDPSRYALRYGMSMDWPHVQRDIEQSFDRLGLPVPPLNAPIRILSGGNLQRLILARELAHNPKLILAFYPNRGLDVPSATSVRRLLVAARDSGSGVLLISEDLGELFSLSDRLLVLYQGRIAGRFVPGEISMAKLGHLMTGSKV
jgi:simple sugar transport system ATP-binding protein